MRVLLAEDRNDDALLESRMIRQFDPGAEISVATSRAEFDQALENSPPDVVISAAHVNDMNVREVMERAGDHVKRVIVTGYSRQQLRRMGVPETIAYVNKNNLSALLRILKDLWKNAKLVPVT